ncbi:MAG: HAMP domain-containing histidine kinase, partial [Myxococcales bacterium]|nr:HAMP domain-containing histidine kinase [Myxococcales bacterium]
FFVRALAVAGTAGVLHFGLAHVLLTLLLAGGPPGVPHGREVVSLAVLATLLAQLLALYLRSLYGDPADVVHSVPGTLRLAAPIATLLFALLVLPPEVLEAAPLRLAVLVAPAAAAGWAAAIIVSIPARQVLHAFAIRAPGGRAPRAGAPPPPTVEQTMRQVFTAASAAVTLLVLGTIAHRLSDAEVLDATMLLPIVGLLAFPALAALAGTGVGQTPAADVVSVARRLDQPTKSDENMAPPVVVTRADEVGELLANLEALRGRLGKDLHRYESVLEQAQAAERIKADFLNAVSHELRTPLNVVGGFTQLLLEGHPTPLTEPQAEDVRLIRAGGKQLLELINDILDISMIESGDLRLHFSRAGLGPLVRETVDFHQPQLLDKPVVLRAEVAPDVPPVECDRRRIGQILTNLVSNAIKFTEEGQIVVRLAYDPHAEAVVLRCIDTGVGIEPDDLDDIFEEYRQAGSATRRKKGTGLGLAIARSIAEHHGGSLTVESEPGRGSTFTLTLPTDPPQRPASIDMTEEAARAAVRKTFQSSELRAIRDTPPAREPGARHA